MPVLSLYRHLVAQRYWISSEADEVHRPRTDDGVRLAIKRFVPSTSNARRSLPILCVPGLGADSHNFDAPAPLGLAPYLRDAGFEVWAPDLRGTGLSEVAPARWPSVRFDDFVERDLPTVLEHIGEVTGQRQVHYLGHSMGGMVLYALLGGSYGGWIRSAITVGTPVGFPEKWGVVPALEPIAFLADRVPGLRVGALLRTIAPIIARGARLPGVGRWIELDNVEPRYVRRLLHRSVQDIPRDLLVQFRDWIANDAFRSFDHQVDYQARAAGHPVPLLVVAGPKDQLGTAASIERALELFPNARHLACGRAGGLERDYGHVDLLFGRSAHEDVFPRLLAFFVEHEMAFDQTATVTPLPRRRR